ncbi:MAG TPA: type IV toxin-antitoxin system AbiEi family antitoxin domain-containing protein [Nakamurella sp.]
MAEVGGLVRATDCRRIGLSADRVERMLRHGSLIALAKGIYADADHVAQLAPWPRFQLRSRAFVLASPEGAYASDWSAVALHEMPTALHPPKVPSVIRLGSRGSGSNRTVHGRTRFASVPDRWLMAVDGVAVLSPALAAVDLARTCDRRMGLMLADAAATRDRSREGLGQALLDIAAWPRMGRSRWAVTNADPDVESPLESVGRFALLEAGLPPGMSNTWIGDGYPQYRLDHYWPEIRLGAEADGLDKYGLTDPVEAIRAEKEREWRLQEWGVRVIRYSWTTAFTTPEVLAHHCAVMMRSPPLPASRTVRTWSRLEGYALRGMTPAVGRWSAAWGRGGSGSDSPSRIR